MNVNKSTLLMQSNPQQIHDHPLNSSTSKAMHAFPHCERFKSSVVTSTCSASFYDVKETVYRNQRATSMGKGHKYDFTKNGKGCPGPNAYYPKNSTIESQSKNGSSFGVSREKMTNSGLSQILLNAKKIPGPGTYQPSLPKSQQTVTFHLKLNQRKESNGNIGPGNYSIKSTFEPSKVMFNSKYKSVKGIKFGKADSKENNRLGGDSKITPIIVDKTYQLNSKGSYFNSKYPNSKCRSFGKELRDNKSKAGKTPGPGQYRLPSDFGIYESARISD